MTLDQLPEGSTILLDANIAIYARSGASAQCDQLLRDCANGRFEAAITTIALAE